MKKILPLIVILSFFFLPAAFGEPKNYKVDPAHSAVTFKVRHLFSKVQGQFKQYEGSFVHDPEDPNAWSAQAVIQAASIDTGVEDRDNHLRGTDFFDVETYPTIEFTTTSVSDASDNKAKLNGTLKMHGVEKQVSLDVEIHGVANDPWGNTRLGATATGIINRKDFGIEWNKAVETGQLLVGEEVEITLEIEGIQEKPQESAEEAQEETAQAETQQ